MIDAKDITRKVMGGCGHSVPIRVPCSHCVEQMMSTWEAAIRDEIGRSEHKAASEASADLKSTLASSEKKVRELQESNGRLSGLVKNLQSENASLTESLGKSRDEADGMRVQLQTEEFAKSLQLVAKRNTA